MANKNLTYLDFAYDDVFHWSYSHAEYYKVTVPAPRDRKIVRK